MRRPLHIFLIILIVLLSSRMSAQETHWEASLNDGYLMADLYSSDNSKYNSVSLGASVSWWYRATGDEYWMRYRHYPSFGIQGSYAILPNSIAGNRLGIIGLMRSPVLVPWLEWNIGLGFSLYTSPFVETGDTNNIFIGSALNCLINTGFTANFSEYLAIGVHFLHSSNGMLYRPNQGYNFLQLDLSYKFGYRNRLVPHDTVLTAPDHYSHELGITVSPGIVMSRHSLMMGYYPCYDVSLNYQYYVEPLFAVGGTLDLWFDGSHWQQLPWYHDDYPIPMYFAAMPFVEGFWGPLSIKVGIGPQLLTSTLLSIHFYERVAAYYNWGNNYVGIGLNAHAGQVSFIEWSYGHRFPLKG